MFKAAKTNLSGAVDEVESIDSDELLIDLPKKRGRPSWIGRLRRNLGGHRSVFRSCHGAFRRDTAISSLLRTA